MSRRAVSWEHLASLAHLEGRELAFEAIQQAVDHEPPVFVQWEGGSIFPESRLGEDSREVRLSVVDGAPKAVEEPFEPGGDIQRSFLRLFEHPMVGVALSERASAMSAIARAMRPLPSSNG